MSARLALELKVGDFVEFEVSEIRANGLSYLPYGQGIAFAAQGLVGHDRLRGVVCALVPSRKVAVIVRLDNEEELELATYSQIKIIHPHELTDLERAFVIRSNEQFD